MKSFTELWDEIAQETADREYQRVGVGPGDHLGYFLKRTAEHDRVLRRLTPQTVERPERVK